MQKLYLQVLHKFTWDLDCYMKWKLGHKIIHTTIQFMLKLEHSIKNVGQILENACKYLMTILQVDQYLYVHVVQTWFKGSVFNLEHIKLKQGEEEKLFQVYCGGYKSYNDIEWICCTPPELKLYPLEEWLAELCIPFIQIKNLQCGRQTVVHGNVINAQVNIAPNVNTLPRHMNDTDTIIVKF